MKTLAKEFGFGTWNVGTMLRPGSIKELIPHIKQYNIACYGHTGDQMARESNNCPQNSYTATDWEKHRKKGVWSSWYSRQYM
jgi:hypothetical protein